MSAPRVEPSGPDGCLPRSEDFGFGRLFDAMGDAVILADEQARIVLWNPSARRQFGFEAEEAVGRPLDSVLRANGASSLQTALAAYRRGEGGEGAHAGPHEARATRKDGSEAHVDVSLSPLAQEGRVYVLAVVRDVDLRVRQRERDELQRRQLQDAIDSLEAFAHVIAHDLKEPVRGMTCLLEELERQPDAEDRDERIRQAASANRDLRRLLDGLLEWGRTAMTPLEPRELPLSTVLAEGGCSAQWGALAAERGARVEIRPDLPIVLGTESLVCSVFGNLITNAIRHNPAPEPLVVIRRGEPKPPGFVEVLIEDNGPGFPETLMRRVRAMPNRPSTIKGGFGIAIAHRAVGRLGGRLALENAPGGGALARLMLPAPLHLTGIEERVRELV